MTKETLTKENIKKDLATKLGERSMNQSDWRLTYIVPFTALAIILGLILQSIWIGLLIFSVAVYHIIRMIPESRQNNDAYKALKTALTREEFSVSVDTLSHITSETIYEPHTSGHRDSSTKTVSFFYFTSGISWRVPDVRKHYPWSKLYYMSSQGLENTSLVGDTFYVIELQADHEVRYIYNTKFFEFKE